MKKGGLRLMMALFCAFAAFVFCAGGTKASAALPNSVKAPESVSLNYAFDLWNNSPSALNVSWKNPSDIKKVIASDDSVGFVAQIDWKFSKDDSWKYSESWDRMERNVEDSYWEYVSAVDIYEEPDNSTNILEFWDEKDGYWKDSGIGFKNVIPKDYLKSFTIDGEKITSVDYNKYSVDVRVRYLCYRYDEDKDENVFVTSDWSDTVTYGNFSKDYEEIDNILVNPDFEDGLDGWKDADKVWNAVADSEVGQARHGRILVWPSKGAEKDLSKTRIYQDVSLEDYKEDETVVFNCLICNYDQAPHDMGKVSLAFLDKDGKTIETYTQAQRNPNWNSQSIICTIPKGAVKVRVSLWAYLYVGSDIDAYYDYCSLVVKPEKVYPVTVTEGKNTSKAKKGDKLQLKASNTKTDKASDFVWSSSYNTAATVDKDGLVTFHTDAEDGVAIYAKDVDSGVTGVYWINSNEESNAKAENAAGQPVAAKLSKLSKAKKGFTVKWAKAEGVDGYEIRYGTSKKMKDAVSVEVADVKTTSKKITGLKGGKKYYVQIRTYAVSGGAKVYSDWSAAKSVKTKK